MGREGRELWGWLVHKLIKVCIMNIKKVSKGIHLY